MTKCEALPLLRVESLPAGLQLVGFAHAGADLIGAAQWVEARLTH